MSDAFFRDLDIPQPDIHLGIGSGSHAEQTGRVMIAFEEILVREQPDLVIVVGDVNSTLACALAAVKLCIPVAHVEAGLRSFDRTMPEEINRILTDAVSDYLFTPSPDGDENLIKEGIPEEKIFLVGDIMVDSLLFNLEKANKTNILHRLGLFPNASLLTPRSSPPSTPDPSPLTPHNPSIPYALLTLHRPANVDSRESFQRILKGLLEGSEHLPILFPMHPRTEKQIKRFGFEDAFEFYPAPEGGISRFFKKAGLKKKIHAFPPLGYLDFLHLMSKAKLVLTDSGGIQEETTVLNIPCITLRDTTERPITVTEGTNVLVHDDPERIVEEIIKALSGSRKESSCPAIWDGRLTPHV
jgi:UDP-N-acetylglucosamine 2-epimerase (non-hydrolysing)